MNITQQNCQIPITALTRRQLAEYLTEFGLPKYRTQQIEQWLWEKGVTSFDKMTNLSKQLRASLDDLFTIPVPDIALCQISTDETRKYLVRYPDDTLVETVGIPSRDRKRLTVCFSTQAGCAMGCTFCATGKGGFIRNLNSGEMLNQIQIVAKDFGTRVSNVVAMGQGEPFLNYDAVLNALHILNDKKLFGIGARHITVSTCGIVDGVERFAHEPEQFTLAVSLHSAIQETRDEIMPGIRGISLADLRRALYDYSNSTGRRPTFEYALIDGVNDDDVHLDALVAFCSGMLSHVNLIPLNPISTEEKDTNALKPSPRIRYFEQELNRYGIECSIRSSRGADIDGACGQLRQRGLEKGTEVRSSF